MNMQHASEERVGDIKILYEDEDVLVIDKPSGIMVHGDGRNTEPTVVDWFLAHAPTARGVGEPGSAQDGTPLERSGVVHRLDKETSGVLVLAKTQNGFTHLKEQFHGRHVRKEYRAFIYGTLKEKWGTIRRPIGRSPRDFRLRSAERGARGMLRSATTDWELLKQSSTHAYVRVLPKTGRTHQIRVHLRSIGKPIVGDVLYAPKETEQNDNLGFSRLALHAYSLTFTLPSGEKKTCIAELPPDFSHALASVATQ